MTGFPPKVARLIFEIRENEACFYCRRPLRWEDRGTGWSLHHRRPRGMGGNREAWVNEPPNGIILCGSGVTGCHGWVEENRDVGYELGLLVRRGEDRPVDVPVRRQDGTWWFLTRWGSATQIDEEVRV